MNVGGVMVTCHMGLGLASDIVMSGGTGLPLLVSLGYLSSTPWASVSVKNYKNHHTYFIRL